MMKWTKLTKGLATAILTVTMALNTMVVHATDEPTPQPQPDMAPGATMTEPRNPADELIALPIPENADDKNDLQVISDYRNGVSIPVAINTSGDWIDQNGHRMNNADARRYLQIHPDYCYVVKMTNIGLTDLTGYSRDLDLAMIPNGEVGGSYSFVGETIEKFKANGTYILMMMCSSEMETLQTYLQWSGKEDVSVPVYKNDNGWVDQYQNPMSSQAAQQCFRNCPEYKKAIDNFIKYGKKYAQSYFMEDSEIFDEAQDIYCRWYMESARYENHIANDMFNGTVTRYSDSSYQKNEYWVMAELAEDFQQMADYYFYWSSAEYTDDAIEALKGSNAWCDACYAMYRHDSEYAFVHMDKIYWDGKEIGYVSNHGYPSIAPSNADEQYSHASYRYCSEGHLCGIYDEQTHNYRYTGDFYNAIVDKREKLNK